MFKNLFKKPKMKDEMLEMKQNQYGARAFNMMIIIIAIVILIKAVVLEASISELWVELLLLIVWWLLFLLSAEKQCSIYANNFAETNNQIGFLDISDFRYKRWYPQCLFPLRR